MSENQPHCFIYPNRLKAAGDAFPRIMELYYPDTVVRREYVVDSPSVQLKDITRENVRHRLEEIVKIVPETEALLVVLAGFSPLVALVYDVAKEMGLHSCYFFKDDRRQTYIEVMAF